MTDIYSMKLHDTLNTDSNINITRVPGGWIYNYVMRNYTVLVPYSDEFNTVLHEIEHQARIDAIKMQTMWHLPTLKEEDA